MNAGVLEVLAPEMELIEEKIGKYCRIRSGYLGEFAHLNLNPTDRNIRPACVLLAVNSTTQQRERVVALAGIIQLIFLAAKIHQAVPEDDVLEQLQSTDPRDGTQLPVLVGDYLYGRFFTSLCEAQLLQFLKPLADIICMINEGSILRYRAEQEGDHSQQTQLKIIEQESATLFAGACRLSSILGQACVADQEILATFGFNLGMAYGILWETDNQELAKQYGDLAVSLLGNLQDATAQPRLRNLKEALFDSKAPIAKTMVG